MTAAGGVIHEEFHSAGFSKTGGPFRVVQLWVNLPARDKLSPPRYQGIRSADIPVVDVDGGKVRVIAGEFEDIKGPASTFTPINLWDVRLNADAEVTLDLPDDTMLLVMTGEPIHEPVFGHGPFVMNSETEIRTAIDDFNNGRFAQIAN